MLSKTTEVGSTDGADGTVLGNLLLGDTTPAPDGAMPYSGSGVKLNVADLAGPAHFSSASRLPMPEVGTGPFSRQ